MKRASGIPPRIAGPMRIQRLCETVDKVAIYDSGSKAGRVRRGVGTGFMGETTFDTSSGFHSDRAHSAALCLLHLSTCTGSFRTLSFCLGRGCAAYAGPAETILASCLCTILLLVFEPCQQHHQLTTAPLLLLLLETVYMGSVSRPDI